MSSFKFQDPEHEGDRRQARVQGGRRRHRQGGQERGLLLPLEGIHSVLLQASYKLQLGPL